MYERLMSERALWVLLSAADKAVTRCSMRRDLGLSYGTTRKRQSLISPARRPVGHGVATDRFDSDVAGALPPDKSAWTA
jgi:hypothetical protein